MDSFNSDTSQASGSDSRNPPEVIAILIEAWKSIGYLQLLVIKRVGFMLVARAPFIIANILVAVLMGYYPSKFLALISLVIHILSGVLAAIILVPVNIASVRNAINLPLDMESIKQECSSRQHELLILIVICITFINLAVILLKALMAPHFIVILFLALIYVGMALCLTSIYMLTFPMIVIQKVDYLTALTNTYEKIKYYWRDIFACFGVIYGMGTLLVALAFMMAYKSAASDSFVLLMVAEVIIFAPLLWLIPWLYATGGILFRELNGLKVSTKPREKSKENTIGTVLTILAYMTVFCGVMSYPYYTKIHSVTRNIFEFDPDTTQVYMSNL